jgi:hypothetical protein
MSCLGVRPVTRIVSREYLDQRLAQTGNARSRNTGCDFALRSFSDRRKGARTGRPITAGGGTLTRGGRAQDISLVLAVAGWRANLNEAVAAIASLVAVGELLLSLALALAGLRLEDSRPGEKRRSRTDHATDHTAA